MQRQAWRKQFCRSSSLRDGLSIWMCWHSESEFIIASDKLVDDSSKEWSWTLERLARPSWPIGALQFGTRIFSKLILFVAHVITDIVNLYFISWSPSIRRMVSFEFPKCHGITWCWWSVSHVMSLQQFQPFCPKMHARFQTRMLYSQKLWENMLSCYFQSCRIVYSVCANTITCFYSILLYSINLMIYIYI